MKQMNLNSATFYDKFIINKSPLFIIGEYKYKDGHKIIE